MKSLLYIEGQLTPENSKTHLLHTFYIEYNVKKLEFVFSYKPKEISDTDTARCLIEECIDKYCGSEKVHLTHQWRDFLPLQNLITISIDDPIKFRGAAHRHSPSQSLFITKENATPGLLPGELLKGKWTVTISAHAIITEVCKYKLSVTKEDL